MSNRIEKVNSLLEKEIGKILQKDFDFSDDGMVTLTHVDASGNLIEAKVYISVYPEEKAEWVVSVLNKAAYTIQGKINRTVRMRPVPKIFFVHDKEVSKAAQVEKLLNQLKKDEK
jgi:ribosome-binding factor A